MSLYAGLDISVKTTAICVLDANGRVILETMVESAPDAISACLHELDESFERIGLEAGPLSQWIYAGLVESGLAAICVETRHMHAVLSARINKTDRNDARGIAQMMRVGLFKAVHVKTPASQHRCKIASNIDPGGASSIALITRENCTFGWGHDWTRRMTPHISIFSNGINPLEDVGGGVIVGRDFTILVDPTLRSTPQ